MRLPNGTTKMRLRRRREPSVSAIIQLMRAVREAELQMRARIDAGEDKAVVADWFYRKLATIGRSFHSSNARS